MEYIKPFEIKEVLLNRVENDIRDTRCEVRDLVDVNGVSSLSPDDFRLMAEKYVLLAEKIKKTADVLEHELKALEERKQK